MKTIKTSFLLITLIAIFVCMFSVIANAETYDDLTYTVSDGEVTITKCDKTVTNVNIPSTIGGYPVTRIGKSAFSDCTSLKSVTIPDNVTEIGLSAFEDCESLENVIIGDGVIIIGASAFGSCPSLISVTIGDSVTEIRGSAFIGCTSLTGITIPDSVTTIGSSAFANCRSLTSITIPEGVTSIGLWAFNSCTGLTQINWNAKNVTDCGGRSVWGGAGQAENGINLVFGANVEMIPGSAFDSCDNLKSVTISDSVTYIGGYAFENCIGLETVTIGDGVTNIGGYSFRGCTSLKNVIIGDSVAEIGLFAFKDCTSLTDITIPDSVTTIGSFAFANCRSLTSITIPEGVTSIDICAFDSCVGLTQINWNAKSVDDIASNGILDDAGQVDNGITVVLGANVEKIPGHAFAYCDSIKSVTIPDSVTSIGDAAFYHCGGLASITIPDSVTKIESSAFAACIGLTNVIIGDSVTNIGYRAFSNCRSLTSVTIGDGVTDIGHYAFQGCTALEEVHISDIASWCGIDFYDHDSNPLYYAGNLYVNNELITNLIVPDDVTSIGAYAFTSCAGLTSVTIPDSVTSIGDSAFSSCTGLKEVHISDIASWYGIVFGNIYSNPLYYAGNLYVNNELITNLIVPDDVTSIGAYAFTSCAGLTSVTIPDSVTSIGYSAFSSCTGLKEVHISDIASWFGIVFGNISSNPLYYAGKLYVNDELITNLIVPDGVTSIGAYAFTSCTGLTSVTIPDSVTSIDSNAFYEIDDLVFYGTSGSVAEQYADSNGYEFIPLRSLVAYDANGGENAPESHVKLYNKNIKLSTAKPIRIGHKFLGWSTDKDATVPEYKPGATYKEDKNLTLYAVWEEVIIPVSKVTLNTTKLGMMVDGEATLTATVSPVDANFQYVTWSSSNESVATVDENGVVTALKAGSVKITATSHNGKKASCTVTIGEPATKVEFTSLKSTSLALGKSITLKAKAACEGKTKPVSTAVVFEIIEGDDIATLDAKGKLTAKGLGEVTVRARAEVGTEEAFADVTINICIPATKVTLSTTKASMALGYGDLELSATMLPADNTDTLTWSVDKPEIATVDENGVVTAHKAGKVKVTAASGSGKKATCTVTIGEPATRVDVTALKTTSVAVGKTITLKGKAACEGKTKPVSTAVVFEIIEGEDLATIDAKGKLTANKEGYEGYVVVRISAEAGTEDAYEDVTIRVCTLATKVTLSMTKATLSVGDELQLEATMAPDDNTDTIMWSVDKDSIATVDENGLVTAHSAGKVKVTARSGSGKKATCTITVTK